jgi:hypothetical protein
MCYFVVLYHELPLGQARQTHWDFMIQRATALRAWALPRPPDQPEGMVAERLPDHRLEYLHYEGPVSGDRGWVTQWDQGTYREETAGPTHLELVLSGVRLAGRIVLTQPADDQCHWRFEFFASRSAGSG